MADDNRLYFVGSSNRVMSATFTMANGQLRKGETTTYMKLDADIIPRHFDIHPDGRFLMRRSVSGEESGTYAKHINVVFNWFTELKQKLPPDKN